MANISVLSENKNNFRDLSPSPTLFAQGTKINLLIPENSRVFFEQGSPTLFPKSSSGNYSGGGTVFIDFQTGAITGKDESSPNFTTQIPSSGQHIACTAALNRSSELVLFYGTQGTLTQVQNGVLSGNLTYLGNQPIDTLKVFTVILTSTNGVNLSSISNSLVFSYLNSLNINVPASRVSYTGLSVNSIYNGTSAVSVNTDTIIREPFLTDVFPGANQYQTARTSAKVGDSIVLERWVNGILQELSVTVTAVTNGANNDTVTFNPAVGGPHLLELRPKARVTVPPVYNLPRALYQKTQRMVYDSGWIPVVTGEEANLQIKEQNWISDPIGCVPMVVWAATKDSSSVVVLSDAFFSDSLKVGVQMSFDATGFGVLKYSVGSDGVFYNLDTALLVTTGFIRIFLREV